MNPRSTSLKARTVTITPSFALSEVDRGFIGGVMVSVLALSEVDRGFIDGAMVSVLALSEVDRGFIDGVIVPMIYLTQGENVNHYTIDAVLVDLKMKFEQTIIYFILSYTLRCQ
jgi:coenzyme F420-reducing hydrogenase beta subunit